MTHENLCYYTETLLVNWFLSRRKPQWKAETGTKHLSPPLSIHRLDLHSYDHPKWMASELMEKLILFPKSGQATNPHNGGEH